MMDRINYLGSMILDLTKADPDEGEVWDVDKLSKRRKTQRIIRTRQAAMGISDSNGAVVTKLVDPTGAGE
jgi:hypothetical protein